MFCMLSAAVLVYGQNGEFIVSQNGHAVGTASYKLIQHDDRVDSASTVKVSMQDSNTHPQTPKSWTVASAFVT